VFLSDVNNSERFMRMWKIDNERSGHQRPHRPSENVKKVRNMVQSDRTFSIRAMAVQLNFDK
jgi:hypothetical protein